MCYGRRFGPKKTHSFNSNHIKRNSFLQLGKAFEVLFLTPNEHADVKKTDKVVIYTNASKEAWLWLVNLKSFEPVHGLSRVIRLIPDKLATAILIRKENLSSSNEDGLFLIDLVLELTTVYKEQVKVNTDHCWKTWPLGLPAPT